MDSLKKRFDLKYTGFIFEVEGSSGKVKPSDSANKIKSSQIDGMRTE